MDSALKSAIVGRNAVIIAAVISLIAQIAKLDVSPEVVQEIADKISDIITLLGTLYAMAAAAYSRHKAKKANQDASEPPSILGISGKASLVYLLYLALASAGLCAILLGTYACVKPVIKQDVVEKIAISISAKALGQHMQGRMEWGDTEEAFVKMITEDGLTLSSGKISAEYLMPKVPALYQREARILMESVGFEFSGDELVSVAKVNKALLLEAVGAFKEGLAYKRQASVGDMRDVNYPVGPYHGGLPVTYLPYGIEVRTMEIREYDAR